MLPFQTSNPLSPPFILLVDDTPSVLYSTRKILTYYNFKVTTARNAEEALAEVKKTTFDLVVCDINLPGRNGLDFLNELKSYDPGIASVVMTGSANSTAALAIEAMKSGALGFVTKPFSNTQLIESVNTALEQARLVRDSLQTEFYTGMLENLCSALLNTMEGDEASSEGSSQRVALFSRAIATGLRLSADEVFQIYLAGLFHDIGKIGVPDHILRKTGPLTAEEVYEIARHPELGAKIVEQAHGMGTAANFIMHHHEWYDGTGYPQGLAGTAIPLGSRIIAIADVYEELTSKRVYAPSRTHLEAIVEIGAGKGNQFDPEIVDLALKVIEEELLRS